MEREEGGSGEGREEEVEREVVERGGRFGEGRMVTLSSRLFVLII